MQRIGNKPRVVDLFAGVGGFSEGLRQAGYEIVLAVDNWGTSLESHQANHPEADHLEMDVHDLSSGLILKYRPDLIIGSPPCQQFSTANTDSDPEGKKGIGSVKKFIELVREVKPRLGLIMENVPNSVKDIRPNFPELYVKVLNAADFGVPQHRRRAFFTDSPMSPMFTHAPHRIRAFNGRVLKPHVALKAVLQDLTSEEYQHVRPSKYIIERAKKNIENREKRGKWTGWAYGKVLDPERATQTIMAKNANYYLVTTGFPTRNGRVAAPATEPSRTLLTSDNLVLTADQGETYRRITTVELRRIMGFVDDYIVAGSRTAQARQLGNAVCPPVARAIGEDILRRRSN